ncbi:hypothetical protein EPA93_13345 [Ktedonosporobacter rubrisoli]|uniref:SRPBCC family protein n=1 Tax=Ktedonosporobacter rubrisoli TaxID=2509675 RepID=A0A4P6JNW7_KTERU|nr:SRPBCC family protein [Ktedonosporobacter rubrisoli]QBD76935.1 hypothetical protein EPA93_13345 [Ktedonosporobacter rubrisoli]
MTAFEYSETLEYSSASVFALLTDLDARPAWIKGILEVRVTPPGPAQLGTSYFEAGKYSGYKSEKTLRVVEFEQDRLLALETEASTPNSFRESYRLEALSEGSCRLVLTAEIGNVPKVAEFFMKQEMKKTQPQNVARLKSLLASRSSQAR